MSWLYLYLTNLLRQETRILFERTQKLQQLETREQKRDAYIDKEFNKMRDQLLTKQRQLDDLNENSTVIRQLSRSLEHFERGVLPPCRVDHSEIRGFGPQIYLKRLKMRFPRKSAAKRPKMLPSSFAQLRRSLLEILGARQLSRSIDLAGEVLYYPGAIYQVQRRRNETQSSHPRESTTSKHGSGSADATRKGILESTNFRWNDLHLIFNCVLPSALENQLLVKDSKPKPNRKKSKTSWWVVILILLPWYLWRLINFWQPGVSET